MFLFDRNDGKVEENVQITIIFTITARLYLRS